MKEFNLSSITLDLENYLQLAYGMGAGVAGGAIFFAKLAILLALTLGIVYLAVIFLVE